MKKGIYGALIVALCSCTQGIEDENEALSPPEENRFIKEVFASNLFEPTELVMLPNEKILYTQRRGGIKQFDLSTEVLSDYDSIPVYLENEDGLLGIALDPEFEQNNWIYLYYAPVGERPINRLSRFSYTSSGLTNEIEVLEVSVQRDECCHTGGSIQFGPGGLLYLSTGDNTNPFASDGYSPSDERPGRSAWDAQRSSSNTNDLRGKILRIKPEPDGTYTIPEGNLFDDEDPLTRPEIYVMGCRNPYRISVDPQRGWLFWGDVGPDAGEDGEGRGPRGHDEFNVASQPGYFGWPLFVGDNYAYHDYDFATGEPGPKHNPGKPVNNSPNNTGLKELPPAQAARIYYPYARYEVFPQVKNGGRNAMAGPVYYSEAYEESTRFPEYLDGRVIFYDWMRGFIYFLELDAEGNPINWYPFMPGTEFNNVIDMEFGPDGQLYMIEYGTGWFTQNENARLSRINYVRGNRAPVMKASLSSSRGAAPLEVTFDAGSSLDYDGDKLQYKWLIDDQVLRDSVFTYTFENEGVYYPELHLSDGKGNNLRKQFVVEVGNEPPLVTIEIEGNKSFFWPGRKIAYSVQVSDLEDSQSPAGVDRSKIQFDIAHYQSTDMAEALGHQTPLSDGLTLIESLDCKACHKVDDKSIGPSYTDVAERYGGDRNALNYLTYKIINGGGGAWGEQAMSAHPDLSTKDAQSIVNYILSLTNARKHPLEGTFTAVKADGRYLFTASYEDNGKEPLRPIEASENVWLKSTQLQPDIFDDSKGIQARNGRINSIYHNSWIAYHGLDLTGIKQLKLGVGRGLLGADISVRVGSPTGEVLGKVAVYPDENTTGEYTIDLKPVSGYQDVYLVFENEREDNKLLTITSIKFVPKP